MLNVGLLLDLSCELGSVSRNIDYRKYLPALKFNSAQCIFERNSIQLCLYILEDIQHIETLEWKRYKDFQFPSMTSHFHISSVFSWDFQSAPAGSTAPTSIHHPATGGRWWMFSNCTSSVLKRFKSTTVRNGRKGPGEICGCEEVHPTCPNNRSHSSTWSLA